MSFDSVAPHYRWLETLVFGSKLQQARVAFIGEIGAPRRVLIVGEGNGRFLVEFIRAYPSVPIDCIEASARMIALARREISVAPVDFIQADVRVTSIPENCYDLIVTHFVLDCFSEKTVARLIRRLTAAATIEARWLIADFCHPPHGWQRLGARALIASMYFFFRALAGIEARQLVDYRPLLREQGFECADEMVLPNEMIRSELWRRR